MIRPTIPLTPRAAALLAMLLLLGFLGNFWSLPLFFGVDFILGSIAVLIVVDLFGVGLGVLAAMIAGSYTYFLWGHPYALIIFTLEAMFVGLTRVAISRIPCRRSLSRRIPSRIDPPTDRGCCRRVSL